MAGGDTLSSLDSANGKEGGEDEKSTHDPLKDEITILVGPSVTNSLYVGMGMAGTWVQMVPLRSDNFGSGRGRGRGGRGGGYSRKKRTEVLVCRRIILGYTFLLDNGRRSRSNRSGWRGYCQYWASLEYKIM